MYIYEKSKLAEHPMLEQAVTLSELTTKSSWDSLYIDPNGGLAITFISKLNEEQIKTILMHFKDLLDGDTDTNNISCIEDIDYSYMCKHSTNDESIDITEIYTPDGYNYLQF